MGRRRQFKGYGRGGWTVTFKDGEVIETGYYPNPRMAVAVAMRQYREQHGKSPPEVKSVKWRRD